MNLYNSIGWCDATWNPITGCLNDCPYCYARKHSQKPREIYGLLESLDLNPKIELFARERRQGWDAWGDELPGTMQTLINSEVG